MYTIKIKVSCNRIVFLQGCEKTVFSKFKLLLETSPSIINYVRTIPLEFTPHYISTGEEGQPYIFYILE